MTVVLTHLFKLLSFFINHIKCSNALLWHEYTPRDFVPLIHGIINYILSQATPDLRQMLLQFIDIMNLMSVANVSVHVSVTN